jgi:hypothetical protein
MAETSRALSAMALNTFLRLAARSYWIPGTYAPTLSEKHKSFLRLLKNKGFQEESMTKVRLDAIGTSTTLESNKSHQGDLPCRQTPRT